MIKKIHENYQAFYNMLIITTLIGNNSSPQYDEDAGKVIEFIGKAYFLDDETINFCKKIILDELVTISTKEDMSAFINSHDFDSEPEDLDSLLTMKCDAINVAESLASVKNVNLNPDWFNYCHYKPYYPLVRFKQLCLAASTGNPIANKAVAMMLYLGLGTKKNVASAIYRLRQCLVWGDVPSIYFLKYIYEMNGAQDEANVLTDLLTLLPYLEEGRTVLPEEKQKEICKDAFDLYRIISSIKQDIVINAERLYIDYSFAEVMISDKLDYFAKMRYINNYSSQEWKEVTNSSHKRIGFKEGEQFHEKSTICQKGQ